MIKLKSKIKLERIPRFNIKQYDNLLLYRELTNDEVLTAFNRLVKYFKKSFQYSAIYKKKKVTYGMFMTKNLIYNIVLDNKKVFSTSEIQICKNLKQGFIRYKKLK